MAGMTRDRGDTAPAGRLMTELDGQPVIAFATVAEREAWAVPPRRP